jgi:hypothetical protein
MAPATSTPSSGLAVTQPIIEATLAVVALGGAALPQALVLTTGFYMLAAGASRLSTRAAHNRTSRAAASAVAPARYAPAGTDVVNIE